MAEVSARAYSTKYEDHIGLIKTLAIRAHKRFLSSGLDVSMEDVYGEMLVAYSRARLGYDPSKGITFTAYLGRACINAINRVYDRMIREAINIKTVRLEDLSRDCESEMDYLEKLADEEQASPEQIVIRLETFREKLGMLSPITRRYIATLVADREHPVRGYGSDTKVIREELQRVYGITLAVLR